MAKPDWLRVLNFDDTVDDQVFAKNQLNLFILNSSLVWQLFFGFKLLPNSYAPFSLSNYKGALCTLTITLL